MRAVQGMRDGDTGIQKITDDETKSEARRIARRIQFVAPLIALAMTTIILGVASSMS